MKPKVLTHDENWCCVVVILELNMIEACKQNPKYVLLQLLHEKQAKVVPELFA